MKNISKNEINNESKKINKNKRNSIRKISNINKNKTIENSNSKNRKKSIIKTNIKDEKEEKIEKNEKEIEFDEQQQNEKENEEEEKKQIEKQLQYLKEIQEKEKKEEYLNQIEQETREIKKEKENQVKKYILEKNLENLTKKNSSSTTSNKKKVFSKEHLDLLNNQMIQNKLNLDYNPYKEEIQQEENENEKKILPVEKKRKFSIKLENIKYKPKKNLIYDNSYLLKKTEDNFTPRIKDEVLDILNNTPTSSNSKRHKFQKKIYQFKKKSPETKKIFSKLQINRMTKNKLFIDQNDADYINSLERKRKLKELEEENERKKNENFSMELKILFENIQRLKHSKNDVTEEIEKLIDRQVENSEYAQFRKLEMRINDFKKNMEKEILKKKNYKQNIMKLKYKSPFYFFRNYNEIKDNYENDYKGAFYIKKKIKRRRSSLFDDLNDLEKQNESNNSSSSSEKSF